MKNTLININGVKCIVYGENTDKIYIYVHGMCGNKEEAESFANFAVKRGYQVISFDLPEHGERKNGLDGKTFYPWDVCEEIKIVYNYCVNTKNIVCIRANSIGALFCMYALIDEKPDKCLFVSPVVDMVGLINNIMKNANVSRERLEKEKIIEMPYGQPLSIKYLQYAENHSLNSWKAPTAVLYPELDNLTKKHQIDDFTINSGCKTTYAKGMEHFFHSNEQIKVLNKWIEENI